MQFSCLCLMYYMSLYTTSRYIYLYKIKNMYRWLKIRISRNDLLLVILVCIFLWEFVFYIRLIKRNNLEEEEIAAVMTKLNISPMDSWILQHAQITRGSILKLRENSCKIPILNPFAPEMLNFFKPINESCDEGNNKVFYFKSHVREADISSNTFSTSSQSMILMFRDKPLELRCCYRQLFFQNTDKYKLANLSWKPRCKAFSKNETIVPSDSEYLVIECRNNTEIRNKKGMKRNNSNSQLVNKTNIHYELLFYVPKPSRELLYTTGRKLLKYKKETGDNTPPLNVIIIGFDSVSRANFIRLMGKTFQYLRSELDAIDLQGFNKMGDATLNNTLALLTGHDFGSILGNPNWFSTKEKVFDDCPWIWKNFSEKGYITALADDYVSVFDYRFKGFKTQPTDYYNSPVMQWYDRDRHEFGTRDCIGNKHALHLISDHAKQMANAIKTRPYFSFMWISKSHEKPGYPSILDKSTLGTLKHFHTTGVLNRSLVILLGDHGWRAGPIMMTAQAKLENRLTFAFLLLPQWFREKYSTAYGNLQENQYRLTSPYDLHSTLFDILNTSGQLNNDVIGTRELVPYKGSKGVSLFLPISRGRSCSEAGIDEEWCACTSYEPFDINSIVTTGLANYAVNTINSWLRPFPSCQRYTLDRVLSVEVKQSEDYLGVFTWRERHQFRISFSLLTAHENKTQKGGKEAHFEVTVFTEKDYWHRDDDHSMSMSTEVFRLNNYNTAACMKTYSLKKICTCEE